MLPVLFIDVTCIIIITDLISYFYIYCNLCHRVIDLGVMTPCETIIETAVKEKAGVYFLMFLFECYIIV